MQGAGDTGWGRGSRVEVDWGWRTWWGSGDPREWRVGEGGVRSAPGVGAEGGTGEGVQGVMCGVWGRGLRAQGLGSG